MADLTVEFPEPCSEDWNAMRSLGCHRHCAACDKVIHDLEALTLEEAEALLAREEEACVRARIGPDGVVRLKSMSSAPGRRIVAAASATLALATAACQTVPVSEPSLPGYRISGSFYSRGFYRTVQLRSSDGQTFPKRHERGTDRFVFEGLAPGTYELTVKDSCGDRVLYQTVTVVDASVDLAPAYPQEGCIIVGAMRASDGRPAQG